jgi:hypothetical protein
LVFSLVPRTCRAIIAAAALVLSSGAATSQPIQVASGAPFRHLSGSWSGGGQIHFADGNTERITCRAYYVPKGAGDELNLAIRCASLSYKIEIRATIHEDNGRIRGRWEERTFNAEGDLTGKAAAGHISMSITGGGLTGAMTIAYGASAQTVSISTQGTGLKGATISLSRS